MTKPQTYTPIEVALQKLTVHPANVRARSTEAYSETSVQALAANIREMGLLQPLLVQATGRTGFGVLAGGRRLAALNLLAADPSAKGFGPRTRVACQLVPEDTPVTAALSLSENEMQAPMDAIDRFEAFTALRDSDGLDVADIARVFGLPERAVRESLRIGLVHSDIRAAHRAGEIALETVKAFAAHPDRDVQREVFEALSGEGHRVEAWSVRKALDGRGTRQGDALGAFVLDDYRAAGGAIAPDLIEEDSVLTDTGLVMSILATKLDDLAEETRMELGMGWADHRVNPDWDAFSAYGRIYPQPVELDAATQKKVDKLTTELDALSEAIDAAADWDEETRLSEEYEVIEGTIEALTHAFDAEAAATAGVIASWRSGRVEIVTGLVRPEDRTDTVSPKPASGGGATEASGPKISAKLADDMACERTRAVGLALAQDPATARVYGDWLLLGNVARDFVFSVSQSSLRFHAATYAPSLGSPEASEGPEAVLDDIEAEHGSVERRIAEHEAALPLDWLDEDGEGSEAAFARFAALDAATRDQLVAWAVSRTLDPVPGDRVRSEVRAVVEATVLPDIRALWTPDARLFGRLTKPDLLRILRDDLGLGEEADLLAGAKKSALVERLATLFADPPVTLTPEAQDALASWCPPEMATPGGKTGDGAPDEAAAAQTRTAA